MSYKDRLSDLTREGEVSLTQQIVDAFAEAIASGELTAGERLPTTRSLAELTGVNHLTAARAYRRLADLGLTVGRVGSGTYVRSTAAAVHTPEAEIAGGAGANNLAWQLTALPREEVTYGDTMLAAMMHEAEAGNGIPLSVGYPAAELFPTERLAAHAAEMYREEGARSLQYAESQGLPELRAELAGRWDAGEDPGDIVVCSGARQALTLVARAIVRPGDTVACESPSFFGVIEALRATGARVLPVPMDDKGLDTDALEQLLRQHEIKLVATQSRIQNPTGLDLSPERRGRLVALARRHGFFVLDDGVYADLRFQGEGAPSLRAEAPDHVVAVNSLSKTLSPGMRIGWVTASGPVIERVAREKRGDDIHSTTPSQMIAARFLAAGEYEPHLKRSVAVYEQRCDVLLEAVHRELGPIVSGERPLGGHHLWLTLDADINERDLYEEAARQGVSFVPGGAMTPERPRRTHLRVSFGFVEPDELVEGARRLGRAVRAVRRAERPARASLPIA